MKNAAKIAFLIVLIAAKPALGQCGWRKEFKKGVGAPSAARGDQPPGGGRDLSVGVARIIVREQLAKRYLYSRPYKQGGFFVVGDDGANYFEAKNIKVNRDALTFDVDFADNKNRSTLHPKIELIKADYIDCHPSYDDPGIFAAYPEYSGDNLFIFMWKGEDDAAKFMAAWNRLVYEARNVGGDPLLIFQIKLKGWREKPETAPKTSEAWDKFRILAEHAYKEGDYISSVKNYELGITALPTWAEGWFNAALLYAGMQEYESAADRMRHYLILMPNAPDAAAARESIIVWEEKAKIQ